ncbi:MAG: heme exporter protein CcmB [Ignavibacteria bacterium]|nr:heme exporter protein CcmB [Ignavibacteria bacterium]MBI3765361.1 heme exporter protein CcmB [Ignavibacteriales bacterium]
MKLTTFGLTSFVLFTKEYRSEIRTRYALNALLMFVVTTLSMILFSIARENVSPEVLAGVLWVIIFFSTMSGLARTFVSEEERGTVLTLQLIARPLTIYIGKLFFNFLLLASINVVTVALYLVLITNFSVQSYSIFALTLILGTLGLAAATTILAAIIAKAHSKGTLFPVICFPILLPLLITVIAATQKAVEGVPFEEASGLFRALIAYIIVIGAVSYILFDYIWKD